MPQVKSPCIFCEHWHTHKNPCHFDDCECPGNRKWHDWVVVQKVLEGKYDQVGRRLTFSEKLDAAQRLIKRGGGPKEIQDYIHINGHTAGQLAEMIREANRAGREYTPGF